MASSLNDPKLLYAITGVSAYHIANGAESSLTPAGPQTLSLLMVPTASPFADMSIDGNHPDSGGQGQEEDFYLHLHLPPELDLPLPATTQIYHQPPSSYLIPRWDLGRNSGVFTRIEFPAVGSRKGLQEDVDTFETILAQCTAFLERAPPPKISSRKDKPSKAPGSSSAAAVARESAAGASGSSSGRYQSGSGEKQGFGEKQRASASRSSRSAISEDLPAYNPAAFKPGEAYAAGSHSSQAGGQLVLIDEEDGSVIGELGDHYQVIEDKSLMPGSKEPVEITLPTEAVPSISVAPASHEYVETLHPAYQKSSLVANAAAASRLIVTTSELVSKALQNQADKFAEKAVPSNKPITFQPSTHEHIRRINTFSAGAAGLSAKAVGQVGKVAQNLGAKLAGHKAHDSISSTGSSTAYSGKSRRQPPTGMGPDGQPINEFRPGLLNKSLMAFSTVADGIEQAGRHLLDTSSNAATTVVSSKWGSEAGEVTRNLTGGIKNVGLVYIDVTGVSRRALIKSVAKGMVIGHVPGGGNLVVGGGDGGGPVISPTGSPPPLPPNRPTSSTPDPRGGNDGRNGGESTSGHDSSSSSTNPSAPVSRVRSTHDFADNNPYRGR
ncbi:SPG20 protein [Sporothrix brasiliensis 5110]|uniref:SPG20 protein n=1 Tax=Sporothrix brasiliensis 5110 TaxID=1398154 RepID=A0A0C2ER96_9PEZI|nr:SPG20 protein [Sporothrix brasiliensis 5110]KIH88909.1 SPG20 protein [Sporothrix brasiliensis 5110]